MPTLICYMKLIVEFLLECDSFLATATHTDTKEVIFNYLAFTAISELDEVYYSHTKSSLKDNLEERGYEIPVENNGDMDLRNKFHSFDRLLLYIQDII